MNYAYQRFWHTTVRYKEGKLDLETTYCDSGQELCAKMVVIPDNFEVCEAWWEVYRAPGYSSPARFDVKSLQGMKAYFGCGKELKNALEPLNFPEARELFAEGVRGVVQAESFLWQKRGFADAKDYEDHWYDLFNGGCRYYNNVDRVATSWYDHVGYTERTGTLFNRFKSQFLALDHDYWRLSGHFVDSFHSVATDIKLEKDSEVILKATGEILRAPDPVCKEASSFMPGLAQKKLPAMNKKEIAVLLGTENGCVHLIDLVADGATTFSLYKKQVNL